MAAPGLEARAPRALGPAHLFFVPMTVARFGRSGEIAQLIIDHVLQRKSCGQPLSAALVVRSSHHLTTNSPTKLRLETQRESPERAPIAAGQLTVKNLKTN
jgi:hypothetical protein